MKVKEANIREMAELILCGQLCFLNTITGDFEYHPAEMDLFPDEENPWQEVLDKLENNWDDYIRIEPMNSNQSFAGNGIFCRPIRSGRISQKVTCCFKPTKTFQEF